MLPTPVLEISNVSVTLIYMKGFAAIYQGPATPATHTHPDVAVLNRDPVMLTMAKCRWCQWVHRIETTIIWTNINRIEHCSLVTLRLRNERKVAMCAGVSFTMVCCQILGIRNVFLPIRKYEINMLDILAEKMVKSRHDNSIAICTDELDSMSPLHMTYERSFWGCVLDKVWTYSCRCKKYLRYQNVGSRVVDIPILGKMEVKTNGCGLQPYALGQRVSWKKNVQCIW